MASFLPSALQSIATHVVRPYSIRELYGWGVLYKLLIGHAERDNFWTNARHVAAVDKRTGYAIELVILVARSFDLFPRPLARSAGTDGFGHACKSGRPGCGGRG